jgi:hypothetical protein
MALALFRIKEGKAARTLEELTPRYLKELPNDPFAERPFGYRVSTGEEILEWRWRDDGKAQEQKRRVAPGQGLVWSVGVDGNDDGGKARFDYGMGGRDGADIIFLEPRWPASD